MIALASRYCADNVGLADDFFCYPVTPNWTLDYLWWEPKLEEQQYAVINFHFTGSE